jgi:Na+-translocating ferredoxin:NAD+ oxidoreductase RnfG subunit
MNNIIKTELLTLVFTVIAMGLFGISTTSTSGDVFGENTQQGENSNTKVITTAADSSSNNNNNLKCSPWDPRGC